MKEHDSTDHYPGRSEILKPDSIGWRPANQSSKEGPVHSNETDRHRNHGPMQRRFAHERQQEQQRKAGSPKCDRGPTRFRRPAIEQIRLRKKTATAPKYRRNNYEQNSRCCRARSFGVDRKCVFRCAGQSEGFLSV